MSLILEALRKSEAERRRGQAPDLRVELPPVAARAPRALPAWAWMAALALALLAAGIAWFVSETGGGSEMRFAPATGSVDAPAGVRSTPDPAERPQAIGTADGTYPRVERITPSAAAAPPTVSTPVTVPAPQDTAAAARPVPATAPEPEPRAEAPQAASPERDIAAMPLPVPRAASGIPRLTELAPDQRQRLPAMKLSMHMWNEDPARRFVVIDGQRRIEGDRIGEATIAAIDRDGVVLDLDGRPVRVPLP